MNQDANAQTAKRKAESAPSAAADRPAPLARRLARSIEAFHLDSLPPPALEKLKICMLDFFACALEARDLPWSVQAASIAKKNTGPATIVGEQARVSVYDAAFANGVAGHGLVREDMHVGSVSHLGVVLMPVLMALAQRQRMSGVAFAAAAIVGYEVGARLGRALVTSEFARHFRPTGFTGPIAGAAAGARALGLDADRCTSALALAANTVSGLNQWPHDGGDDMFFHPGFAARSALTAIELAEAGARGSESALDGVAGLFAGYAGGRAIPPIELFTTREPEIMAVYNKPVPACNFAQTPCQAALALVIEEKVRAADIRAICVRAPRAAVDYPGCDFAGPFDRLLQAKMSIQFGVASSLLMGSVEEKNFRVLDDAEICRLAAITRLEADARFTAAYPAKQGAEVEVELAGGKVVSRALPDVVPATFELVRRRFRAAAAILGRGRPAAIEQGVDALVSLDDVGALVQLTAATR